MNERIVKLAMIHAGCIVLGTMLGSWALNYGDAADSYGISAGLGLHLLIPGMLIGLAMGMVKISEGVFVGGLLMIGGLCAALILAGGGELLLLPAFMLVAIVWRNPWLFISLPGLVFWGTALAYLRTGKRCFLVGAMVASILWNLSNSRMGNSIDYAFRSGFGGG
jgi:hypothetical protein